jgi:P-type E1-E2 ATPase
MIALAKLTAAIESKVTLVRGSSSSEVNVKELVPGDVILLVGGTKVPADVMWRSGDKMAIDTAALTGEPIPRTYPSDRYGTDVLCGTVVKEGEGYCQVLKTGEHTE